MSHEQHSRTPDQGAPVLLKNYMRPCLLLLLAERPAHGYDLLARLPSVGLTRPQRDGRYADSGFVYRTLRSLEREGMLCSTGGGPSGAAPRRIYELTLKGRKELDRRSLALMETSERVETFLTRYGSTDVACPGTAEARRIPAHLTQAVLRRPLGALNPLRRKSEPGDSPNLRQADHA